MKLNSLNVAAALGLGAVLVLSGCGERGEDPAAEMRRAQETPGAVSAPAGAPVVVASLAWDVPEAWTARAATSEMRKAEFVVAGEGELVFFHFGRGQGGSATDNLDRWARTMTDSDGNPVTPELDVIESDGLRTVTGVYTGTYLSGPPAGERTALDGWMLLGAIVEGGPEGSVFLRLSGPETVIRGVVDEWRTALASVRNAGL